MMLELDEATTYRLRSPITENWWVIRHETWEGHTGWFCYEWTEGGYQCRYLRSEEDILAMLSKRLPRLTVDDVLECGLWIQEGGLEEFFGTIKEAQSSKEADLNGEPTEADATPTGPS